MKKYQLFGEWNNATLYGESLSDALFKEKELCTAGGEKISVVRADEIAVPEGCTRGNKPFVRALVKLADQRTREVDAVETEIKYL